MFNKSKVLFKGKGGGGLTVVLDENASYEELKSEILKKVKKSKTFFKGAAEDVQFEGKELTSEQENEIVKIISDAGLEVGFINAGSDSNFAAKKSEEPNGLLMESDIISGNDISRRDDCFNSTEALENVLIYNGFVRSGTLIESEGNIIIMGGVNPGGEVFAGRNIIVFGQLKGKAVAGRSGDVECFIAAILMEPELLGISNYITRFPDAKKDKLHKTPSIARLKSNKIVIAPAGNQGAIK